MKAGLADHVVKSSGHLQRLRLSLKNAVDLASSRVALSDRETLLSRSLVEQRTIVQELHHRVKNNLQTMTSLLLIRARWVDPVSRGHLDEIAGRMEALAAVQARLYDTAQLDFVDFRAALDDIAAALTTNRSDGRIALDTRFEVPLELNVAKAMPLSLLCYEVILNAFMHAWPEGQCGRLSVELVLHEDLPENRISDDGVGCVKKSAYGGLWVMLTRSLAREAGVALSTLSVLGEGTQVSVRVL